MKRYFRLIVAFCLLFTLLQGSMFPLATSAAHLETGVGDSPLPPGGALSAPSGMPKPVDDSHFGTDTGYDLDLYLFRTDRPPDGMLNYKVMIQRYFFNTADANANIRFDSDGFLTTASVTHITQKKILPATVRLEMRVYDVDEEATWCPEVDLLFINGKPLMVNGRQARLSGANEVWSMVSFNVPISMLKFPQSKGSGAPPTAAENSISIQIDASKCMAGGSPAWAVKVDYGMLEIPGTIRPVVFAHGWTGTTSSFNIIEDRLKADGIPSGGQADLREGIYPIPQTANWLSDHIKNAAREYGVNKVNLFAHSKGGLVSRRALYDAAIASMVDRLVTFDSPHHGTSWAGNQTLMKLVCEHNKYPTDPTKARLCLEATQEFTIEAVRTTFNYSGCTYSLLTGWKDCKPIYVRQPSVNYRAFAAIGDPVVIPKATAGYPWNADGIPFPASLNVDAEYFTSHGGILERLDSYRCSIHLLDSSRYSCPGSNSVFEPMAAILSPSSLEITADQEILSAAGSLAGAGLFTTQIPVNSGSQLVLEVYGGAGLAFTLLEPGGRIINPAVADGDPLIDFATDQAFDLEHPYYVINNPKTGTWEAQVQSAAAADFVITGRIASPVTFQVAADQTIYRPGNLMTLQSALLEGGVALAGGTVNGNLTMPDGSTIPLNFNDQGANGDATPGDGIFTARLTAPNLQANLPVSVIAELGNIHREKNYLVAVSNQTANLVGVNNEWSIDKDGDGLIDALALGLNIEVLQSGYFDLQADLTTTSGSYIQSAQTQSRSQDISPLSPGIHSLVLYFDGQTFWKANQGGQYLLTNLHLSDSTNQLFNVDEKNNLYTTNNYSLNQFEHPNLWIVSSTETAVDQNGNNRYDLLTFHIQVGLVPTGNYILNGRLVDIKGEEIAWSETSFVASSDGVYPVDLSFDGNTIGSQGANGPYTLKDVSIYNLEGTALDTFSQILTTQAYSFTQFEKGFYRSYLPVVTNNFFRLPPLRFYGHVSNQGANAPGEPIYLWFYNGTSWRVYMQTSSNSAGNFEFNDIPPLSSGQYYEIDWYNFYSDPNKLSYYFCYSVTSTTTDPNRFRCDFDVQGINLLQPSSGATISLPSTFTWSRRVSTTDSYELDLYDAADGDPYMVTPKLGYVGSYTLNSLPTGFLPNTPYEWTIYVYGANGAGGSYNANQVTFSNTGLAPEFTQAFRATNWLSLNRFLAIERNLRDLSTWRRTPANNLPPGR